MSAAELGPTDYEGMSVDQLQELSARTKAKASIEASLIAIERGANQLAQTRQNSEDDIAARELRIKLLERESELRSIAADNERQKKLAIATAETIGIHQELEALHTQRQIFHLQVDTQAEDTLRFEKEGMWGLHKHCIIPTFLIAVTVSAFAVLVFGILGAENIEPCKDLSDEAIGSMIGLSSFTLLGMIALGYKYYRSQQVQGVPLVD